MGGICCYDGTVKKWLFVAHPASVSVRSTVLRATFRMEAAPYGQVFTDAVQLRLREIREVWTK